jgi:hypothetical protein
VGTEWHLQNGPAGLGLSQGTLRPIEEAHLSQIWKLRPSRGLSPPNLGSAPFPVQAVPGLAPSILPLAVKVCVCTYVCVRVRVGVQLCVCVFLGVHERGVTAFVLELGCCVNVCAWRVCTCRVQDSRLLCRPALGPRPPVLPLQLPQQSQTRPLRSRAGHTPQGLGPAFYFSLPASDGPVGPERPSPCLPAGHRGAAWMWAIWTSLPLLQHSESSGGSVGCWAWVLGVGHGVWHCCREATAAAAVLCPARPSLTSGWALCAGQGQSQPKSCFRGQDRWT